jgi:hypothetical protein
MVAFNDRRDKHYDTVEEVASHLDLAPGDTIGHQLIGGRYLVRGTTNEAGHREYVIHEALSNGKVIERGKAEKRYQAKGEAEHLVPTSVYDI